MDKRVPTLAAVPDDEKRLAEGCRAGDTRALDRFFRLYAPRVERVLGRLLGPTADLEDAAQNTFIAAFGAFHRFRGEASLATWVTRIAVHVAYEQLRRGVRRHLPLEAIAGGDGDDDALRADDARPVDRVLDERRLAARLHAALDRIKPKKRLAFLLYTIEGHSIEEVAALTATSRAAAKSRIWFARRELVALAKSDPVLRELLRDAAREGR